MTTDAHYGDTSAWMARAIANGEPTIIPAITLAEVAGAIARRTGSPVLGEQAVQSLLALSTLQIVVLDEQLGRSATRIAARLKLRVIYNGHLRRHGWRGLPSPIRAIRGCLSPGQVAPHP